MKEINVAAATTTISDRERKYLFVEYEALLDEVNRIAQTTEFNGLPLLNGTDERVPEELLLRVGDPTEATDGARGAQDDVNVVAFTNLRSVIATAAGLGLRSARDLLEDSVDTGGIALEDVLDLMAPENNEEGPTAYDAALQKIANFRATYGAYEARLNRAMDYIDVYQENIAAAKSTIADVDYAQEMSRLVKSRMLVQASTAMLAQSNLSSQLAINLLNSMG